jgi:hypothetical protein
MSAITPPAVGGNEIFELLPIELVEALATDYLKHRHLPLVDQHPFLHSSDRLRDRYGKSNRSLHRTIPTLGGESITPITIRENVHDGAYRISWNGTCPATTS